MEYLKFFVPHCVQNKILNEFKYFKLELDLKNIHVKKTFIKIQQQKNSRKDLLDFFADAHGSKYNV